MCIRDSRTFSPSKCDRAYSAESLNREMSVKEIKKIISDVYKRQQYDYKFVCLSHNTLRGAAGGAVLLAELLCAEGYMD